MSPDFCFHGNDLNSIIKNLFWPTRKELEEKCWHRLYQVLAFFLSLVCFIFAVAINEELAPNLYTATKISLKTFTLGNKDLRGNQLIQKFTDIPGPILCVRNEKKNVSKMLDRWTLERHIYCSANLKNEPENIANWYLNKESFRNSISEVEKEKLIKTIKKEVLPKLNKRTCMLLKDAQCDSEEYIIKLKPNMLHKAMILLISLLYAIGFWIILRLFYYHAILYIVIGKSEE